MADTADATILLNGIWKFTLTPPTSFWQNAVDPSGWDDIVVPGEPWMQGFPIDFDVEYPYKQQIDIPSDFAGKRVFLRFDGVYSSARVWVNGQLVGQWRIPARGPVAFQYDTSWYASPDARPLSLSLPMNLDNLPLKGETVGFYFDNLLPDSEHIRRRLQSRFHTQSRDAFDLLQAIGRDCVGAVQLLPEHATPEEIFSIHAEPLG